MGSGNRVWEWDLRIGSGNEIAQVADRMAPVESTFLFIGTRPGDDRATPIERTSGDIRAYPR